MARVDLDAMRKSTWIKTLLTDGDVPPVIEGCRDLLLSADALTLGVGNETLELYVEGAIKPKAMTACVDGLATDREPTEEGGTKDVVKREVLGDDLHAILVGPAPLPTATRARLRELAAADPGPGGQVAWLTARNTGGSSEIASVDVWLSAKDGLDAHVGFEFVNATDAATFATQATVMLTAMRFSEETADIAKAVDIEVRGKTISAEVHATEEMVEAGLEASKKAPSEKERLREEEIRKRVKGAGGFSFSFSFG